MPANFADFVATTWDLVYTNSSLVITNERHAGTGTVYKCTFAIDSVTY